MADKPMVTLSTSDCVGAVERGMKEILLYLGSVDSHTVNVDAIKTHIDHLISHLDRLKVFQSQMGAANANTSAPKGFAARN